MMGAASVYDSTIGDGDIPEPIELGRLSDVRTLARFNSTANFAHEEYRTKEECWDNLQPTLKVLHKVAPHVESWINDQQANGKIIYEGESRGLICTFDCISRELTIYPALWSEQDGIKASILAHEWRHSRQNPQKFAKYVLSYVITRELKDDLVENDAYLYEKQTYEAIYGTEMAQRPVQENVDRADLPVREVARRRKGCLLPEAKQE